MKSKHCPSTFAQRKGEGNDIDLFARIIHPPAHSIVPFPIIFACWVFFPIPIPYFISSHFEHLSICIIHSTHFPLNSRIYHQINLNLIFLSLSLSIHFPFPFKVSAKVRPNNHLLQFPWNNNNKIIWKALISIPHQLFMIWKHKMWFPILLRPQTRPQKDKKVAECPKNVFQSPKLPLILRVFWLPVGIGKILFDWIFPLLGLAIEALLRLVGPYRRGFFCDDDSIRLPYKTGTVPVWLLLFYCLAVTGIAVGEKTKNANLFVNF